MSVEAVKAALPGVFHLSGWQTVTLFTAGSSGSLAGLVDKSSTRSQADLQPLRRAALKMQHSQSESMKRFKTFRFIYIHR